MVDKEKKLRSILFIVVGVLLVLSLIICIVIVSGEKDLVPYNAEVKEVQKDATGQNKNKVKVIYNANGEAYEYTFTTSKNVQKGSTIKIYYHSNNPTDVENSKTSKLIFICPIVGIGLCCFGLYEIFKRNSDGIEDFKTQAIGVIGGNGQLKIVPEDDVVYKKEPEEEMEVEVKKISKPIEIPDEEPIPARIDLPEVKKEERAPIPEPMPPQPQPQPVVEEKKVIAPTINLEEEEEPQIKAPKPAPGSVPKPEKTKKAEPAPEPKKAAEEDSVTDALVKKVKDKGKTLELSEEDLKEAIKDVLAEVIQEVKEEKKTPKVVEQQKVIPNYYYISGTSLIFELPGKDSQELELKSITSVVRTVNSEGNVVKLVVESPEYKCVLTNMKNIDLEQVANLLHNKLRTMDENFNEVIEHKEY